MCFGWLCAHHQEKQLYLCDTSYLLFCTDDWYAGWNETCAPSWLYLQDYTRMHSQQNIKNVRCWNSTHWMRFQWQVGWGFLACGMWCHIAGLLFPNILKECSAYEMLGSTNWMTQHHVPGNLNACHCFFVIQSLIFCVFHCFCTQITWIVEQLRRKLPFSLLCHLTGPLRGFVPLAFHS